MPKKLLLVGCLLFLGGCGNQLVNQAVRDAKIALDQQNYERAISLLLMASEEGAHAEVQKLQEQIHYLIAMKGHLNRRQLDAALLEWTELNLSPSESRIVKDEAKNLLRLEILASVAQLQQGTTAREEDHAEKLVQRLSTFEIFQQEIAALRDEKY